MGRKRKRKSGRRPPVEVAEETGGRPPWGLWGLGAAGLGVAWLGFHSWRDPNFILIPIERHLPVAPLYSFFMPQVAGAVVLPLLLLAAAAWGWRRLPAGRPRLVLGLLLLLAFGFRLAVHAGRTGTLPGVELSIPHDEEVIYDVQRIESAATFLRDYTELQPELSLHGRTKPPGFALLLYGMVRAFGFEWTVLGTLLTLLASAIVIPAYFLRPGGEPGDGRTAALLVALLPSAVLYGAVTLDAVFAVVSTTAMALALHEAARPGPAKRGFLGLALFAAMMLSYSAFLVLGFVGVVLILRGWRAPRTLALQGGTVLAAFVAPFVLLYLATGFDALLCFRNARALNTGAMRFMTGRDVSGFDVWSYTSVGNLLAFLLLLGVPLVVGLVRYPWRRPPREDLPMAVAWSLTLLVASVGGLYLMETERILLFLVPPAAALAVRRDFSTTAALLVVGLHGVLVEVLLFTIW